MLIDKISRRYASLAEPGFFKAERKHYFRVNTIKCKISNVTERFSGYGFHTKNVLYDKAFECDSIVSKTLEHFMGRIYIQDLSSMLPAVAARKYLFGSVLDACAAPGSKTTQIADEMENVGNLVANDSSMSRIKALKGALERCGVMNCVVTNSDILRFSPPVKFDSVFLDAPCSGEGICSEKWSEKTIQSCARLQKIMALRCFDMLREGGTMVYSTCTYAPEENEEVIQHLLDERECIIENPELDKITFSGGIEKWGKNEFSGEISKCVRLWPFQNDTDGFFLALVRKEQ